jgi:hypothetical protein
VLRHIKPATLTHTVAGTEARANSLAAAMVLNCGRRRAVLRAALAPKETKYA